MILVLTYHKVLPGSANDPDFYNVTEERFETQLQQVKDSGFSTIAPETLTQPDFPTDRPCLLTFDDGTLDHFEIVLPILARLRCQGVFFVLTSKLGKPGYLTGEMVRQISREGHTIGCHSHTHKRLDRMAEQEVRVQLETSREAIRDLTGAPPALFAPPGGFINRHVRELARGYGMPVIRTMKWGCNLRHDLADLECVPLNRFQTKEEFDRVLRTRRRSPMYAAKEIAKRLVPSQAYETLRALFFAVRHRR